MSTATRRCCGCCAIRSVSPERSSAAASPSAAPAQCSSTADRCGPVRCRCRRSASGEITTIEAISGREAEAVQKAWIARDVPQCGYCQSGQVMSAIALLKEIKTADRPRHRSRHERQHLPLRHLCPHPRRHQGCGAHAGGLSHDPARPPACPAAPRCKAWPASSSGSICPAALPRPSRAPRRSYVPARLQRPSRPTLSSASAPTTRSRC